MSDSISVYGYDSRMLPTFDNVKDFKAPIELRRSPDFYHASTTDSDECLLLMLPVELRLKILEFVLPHTINIPRKGMVWIRGSSAVLATSRLLYHEGLGIMYGRNTFVIDVVWDGITFAYQWLLQSGLVPKRTLAFPAKMAKRNISQIRRLVVRIHHVDNYTGMVKHNFGGPGLRGMYLQS